MYNQEIKKTIDQLNDLRNEFLKRRNDSYDEISNKYLEEFTEIDNLAINIRSLLIKHKNELEVDYILDKLTYLGEAPNLIYDDNGHWAVTCCLLQTVGSSENPIPITKTVFTTNKNEWTDTIREALEKYFLEED